MTIDPTNVPLVDLKSAHSEIAAEINEGFNQILATGAFIKGPEVDAFEREFAEFSGVAHCIGVGNGTDAIELALRTIDIPAGSEVIIPANTFVATAEAVVRAGARPVLVDVDPDYLLMKPDLAAKAVSSNTIAIMPVHLFGQLAPMDAITEIAKSSGIAIIEDAAQSHGATQNGLAAGAFGMAAGVSFYPGKNLGAYGDAGSVLTNSADVARSVRLLGDHGSEHKYIHDRIGFNSRLDALQAVVLRAKLRRLTVWNEARRAAAGRYAELLTDMSDVIVPQVAPNNVHVWHLYVIQVPRRDEVLDSLRAGGIQAGIHYPVPVHMQPAFRQYGYRPGDFPATEAAADRMLSLPLYPHITVEQQVAVVDKLREALALL